MVTGLSADCHFCRPNETEAGNRSFRRRLYYAVARFAALVSIRREDQHDKNCRILASYLGLFPVSQSHKLIQNFLQSLEPPFVVGGCPSISPVHLRAVRFTDLGYFFPKFLDTL